MEEEKLAENEEREKEKSGERLGDGERQLRKNYIPNGMMAA